MATNKQKIIVVIGPTASGKTDLAVDIATKFNGEVVSADSRQIYRSLDIGTAKITEEEMRGIPHHMIDIVDVGTTYTAAHYKRDARKILKKMDERDKIPIIAGGTFFYVDTLLEKIAPPAVSPNPKLRAELDLFSTEQLFVMLTEKDPRRASEIDHKNKRRLIRALEIIDKLDTVPEMTETEIPYNVLTIGIKTDRDDLRARLRQRGEIWLENGFVEEIEGLLKSGISKKCLVEIGFEYMIGVDYVDGKLTKEKFIEVFEQKNWQYAKRQLTWLKRDGNINWVTLADKREVEFLVKSFLVHN